MMKTELTSRQIRQLERISTSPMAMRPDALKTIMARIVSVEIDAPELEASIVERPPVAEEAKIPRLAKVRGAVAVFPVYGGIGQHRGGDYWASVYSEELVRKLADAIDNPNVGAAVLSFDTPGGIVYGLPEAAQAIRELSARKPIYGHVKGEAASAGYFLASSTTKLFANPSAEVGSIGTWTMHINAAKMMEDIGWEVTLISAGRYKVEQSPYGPLGEDAKAAIQKSVDAYNDGFLEAVAIGRGVSKATVASEFGEGRMVKADTAKPLGMIDGIATLDELLAGIMQPAEPSGGRRSMSTRIAIAKAWDPEIDL